MEGRGRKHWGRHLLLGPHTPSLNDDFSPLCSLANCAPRASRQLSRGNSTRKCQGEGERFDQFASLEGEDLLIVCFHSKLDTILILQYSRHRQTCQIRMRVVLLPNPVFSLNHDTNT